MEMVVRAIVAGLAVAALSLGLAACGDDGQTDKPDGPDKLITVYSGRSESLIKPLLEEFTKASGITVEVRYGDTAAMAAQLLEEGSKSPADVFLAQDAGALGTVAKKLMFANLPPAVLSKVPAGYQASSGAWVGVTGRSRVLVYNAEQVAGADLPKSVFDLTQPQWKGRFAVAPANGSFQAFVTAMRVDHGEDRTKQWLDGIKANDVQIRSRNGEIVADVNAGKLSAGLVNHYYLYEKAKADGVPAGALKTRNHFFPGRDTGALVNVSGVGVLRKAAKDEDVRAFVDYLLSVAGQKYFATETYEYPLVAGVTSAPGLPELTSLGTPDIDLNDLDTLEATVAMIKEAGLA